MTLIVAGNTRGYAFHASDRLITVAQNGTPRPWDAASNKTVIVMGSDCWLVIGYTGLAFLDSKPADQFIAEAITGVENLGGAAFSGWAPQPGQMHYRAITQRVESAMAGAYTRLTTAERLIPTTLLGVGLQQTSSPRLRHLMFQSRISAIGVEHEEMAGRNQPSRRFQISSVGSVDLEVLDRGRARLRERGDESPEVFGSILMDVVQQTGEVSDAVGEDAVGVILAPTENKIDFKFRLADSSAQLPAPKGSDPQEWQSHPRIYTPFLITPGSIFHPALASAGGWIVSRTGMPPLNFVTSGDGMTPEEGRAFTESYSRRPKPR